jgi:hypothetical protein
MAPDLHAQGYANDRNDRIGNDHRDRQALAQIDPAGGIPGCDEAQQGRFDQDLECHHDFDQIPADQQAVESGTQQTDHANQANGQR